ncbi:glycosyltransferase [Winogradskyella ouciana]|uniref:Glycosyltransferase n=1 Tax=Winogradskyella ouciana TaxID=2608631 RepID=A0A7K1G9J0_9FLAO|nr:glycosyltransferase [Winogradskyella ouciana]MTE25821.1 glycosyltransferase [Winogradskyella ouciana]
MKLSIIIPLYNSGHFLGKCIDSLLRQNLKPEGYEILVINDGSTDNSLEVALKFEKEYSNINVFTKTNGGVGSARNMGMSLAKGEYIYFIDPDDYLTKNVLQSILNEAINNSLDILTFLSKQTTDPNFFSESPQAKNIQSTKIYNGVDYIANNRYQNEVWWYIIKRSFIEETKIRFIEDRWMEDAIITPQLFLKANRIAKFPIDAHRHLIVKDSAMKSKEPTHYLRVIDDNRNAAIIFESIIEDLEKNNSNPNCIKRLRTRQQSFVFFMMVRMMKSTLTIDRVKLVMNELSTTGAYPMDSFVGKDYKGVTYTILTKLFNNKNLFYVLFRLFNPLLK